MRHHRRFFAIGAITLAITLQSSTSSAQAETWTSPLARTHISARSAHASSAVKVVHAAHTQQKFEETVLAIGGSAAHGWKDPNNNSYLKRAFQTLSDTGSTTYTFDDETIVGGRPTTLGLDTFTGWLDQDHPQVVVISWGLLNDIAVNTPMPAFRQAVHDEILESLVSHAVVLVVTPPVVKATATSDRARYGEYAAAEQQVVATLDNKNVHWLDLNADMDAYMQARGETWEKYYGDDWHPNEAGHILGGELLYEELTKTFGSDPITFEKQE